MHALTNKRHINLWINLSSKGMLSRKSGTSELWYINWYPLTLSSPPSAKLCKHLKRLDVPEPEVHNRTNYSNTLMVHLLVLCLVHLLSAILYYK